MSSDVTETGAVRPSGSAADDVLAFDGELETLRRRILTLTCMISASNYLAAWGAKQDVVRAIERVEQRLAALPEGPVRDDATGRRRSVLEIAEQMMARAPSPSPDAIRQARSTDWAADRGTWKREEREWLARNASAGPALHVPRTAPRTAEHRTGDEGAGPPDPDQALRSFQGKVARLETVAHAVSEAVLQWPAAAGGEDRGGLERVRRLIIKAAEEATAAAQLGNELVAAVVRRTRP